MAFDAGFLSAVVAEITGTALGGRIEKVTQPERDTVILQMRTFEGGRRLLINAGCSNPRIGFTGLSMENPQNPPQFCVLLRKHLSGAKLSAVRQEGFERVAVLTFETHDEMGYPCKRMLYAEIMGKYSNLIFTDGDGKILSVLRPVDFSTSSRRQVLPGMRYELPPPQQGKHDPRFATEKEFGDLWRMAGDRPAAKWITSVFLGISDTVAREIVFRASKDIGSLCEEMTVEKLFPVFSAVLGDLSAGKFEPSLVYDTVGHPADYAFLPLTQYGTYRTFDSPSALLDIWFGIRDREARVHQRAADLLHLLNSARARVTRKLELQRGELADCEKGGDYKRAGDLIVANCYLLKKGMTRAVLTDYADCRENGAFGTVTVELDARLAPAANAQRFYKKYAKCRNAKVELTKQIELGETELSYLDSVGVALANAETPSDLSGIREELEKTGYASRMKSVAVNRKKTEKQEFAEFQTSGGYRVLCGKNNLQNEQITHKIAAKGDYWFHAKKRPGSHVVLLLEGKPEPSPEDLTQAAEIAALYSGAAGAPLTEVDYTHISNLHKVSGAKPGFVIYHTNRSAVVSPDRERIAAWRRH